jgi:hypothetical protein
MACGAIGRLLLPCYSYEAALASSRRMRAIKTLDRMVEDGVDDRVEIVSVEPQAA